MSSSDTSSTGKKKISRLDQLLKEKKYLLDSLGWIRRHDRYMCRNRDGRYSIQDFTLSQFASDIATKLLADNERDIQVEEEEIKIRASLSTVRDRKERLKSLKNEIITMKIIFTQEEDIRTSIEDLETVEYNHLHLLSKLRYVVISTVNNEYIMMTPKDSSVSFIEWAESAARDDIVNGENEDFLHMISFIKSQL